MCIRDSGMIGNLDPGYYVVEQTSAPAGYVITDVTKTFRAVAGQMEELTFINRSKPYIIATGTITGTSIPVPGATYQLMDATNTQVLQTKNAGADGTAIFDNLIPGSYVVQCTGVPDGYTLSTGAQSVSVSAVKAGVANFAFDRHSSIIVKALSSEGEPLEGAQFQVRSENGQVREQVTTDLTGTAVVGPLTPGKYIIFLLYTSPDCGAVWIVWEPEGNDFGQKKQPPPWWGSGCLVVEHQPTKFRISELDQCWFSNICLPASETS